MWALESEGFKAQSGIIQDANGKPYSITRVSKEDGPVVIIPELGQSEYLSPTQVANLDRRLGLTSPFFSVDDAE